MRQSPNGTLAEKMERFVTEHLFMPKRLFTTVVMFLILLSFFERLLE